MNLHQRFSSFDIKIAAYALDLIATIVVTLHVLVIHAKLEVVDDSNEGQVVLNGRESIEQVLLIISAALYIISFLMFIYVEFRDKHESNQRLSRIERTAMKNEILLAK